MAHHDSGREYARFSRGTIVLHWLMATLILLLYVLGWYMIGLEPKTQARGLFFNIHKSFGLLAMVIICLFCVWRMRYKAPPYPPTLTRWEHMAAIHVHRLTYILLILVPLAGYMEANFNSWGITVFNLFYLPPWGPGNTYWRGLLKTVHIYSANLFSIIIAVHIAAALKHAFLDRDRILQRMLPWF